MLNIVLKELLAVPMVTIVVEHHVALIVMVAMDVERMVLNAKNFSFYFKLIK